MTEDTATVLNRLGITPDYFDALMHEFAALAMGIELPPGIRVTVTIGDLPGTVTFGVDSVIENQMHRVQRIVHVEDIRQRIAHP